MSSPAHTFRPTPTSSRHLPAFAAAAVVGVVLVAGVAGGFGGGGGGSTLNPVGANASSTSGPDTTVIPSVGLPPSTQAVVVESSESARELTSLSQPLGYGSAGEPVRRLQERLDELGFFVGPVDGQYGDLTRAAVWAFEKLVLQVPRDEARGVVTDDMWQFMQQPIQIQPRRRHAAGQATENHTEVYLPEQVVIFFVDDKPALISHASSGAGEEWKEEVRIDPGEYGNENGTEPLVRGEIGVSVTPGGIFTYDRMIEGLRNSALGGLWNPAYFNYGIAIHGAINVPLHPASHGCVRIPLKAGEVFHQYISKGDQLFVWDGIKEPEVYAQNPNAAYPRGQLPIFNRIDPDYTTTTSTTTVAPTTVAVPNAPAASSAPETTG